MEKVIVPNDKEAEVNVCCTALRNDFIGHKIMALAVATDTVRLWILKFENLCYSYATCDITVTHSESVVGLVERN